MRILFSQNIMVFSFHYDKIKANGLCRARLSHNILPMVANLIMKGNLSMKKLLKTLLSGILCIATAFVLVVNTPDTTPPDSENISTESENIDPLYLGDKGENA